MSGKKLSKSRRRRIRRAAAGTAALVLCVFLLFATFGCAVDEMEVTGNYHETDEEVRELLGTGPFSNSSVMLCLFNRNRTVSGNTFVDTLKVDLDGLHKVKVNVREKNLIGCVEYQNRYWYFNRSGMVLVESGPIVPEESSQAEDRTDSQIQNADSDAESTETAAEESPVQVFARVVGSYELAPGTDFLPDVRIISLTTDPVIYGDEYVEPAPEAFAPEETSAEGSGEVYEEMPAEENGETYEDVPAEETVEETAEESAEENGEVYEETPEEENGETYEEIPEEETAEESTEAAENGEIIEPSVISEDSSIPAENSENAQRTWEIDTSAKGGNYLPVVRGLVFSEAVVGYPLPVQYDRVFSSIAVLKSFVDRSGYVPDDVTYDADGNLLITYGQAQINLGKGDNIETRVAAVGKTLPSIAGLSGTLHLENYDGTQNRFIFSKNKKTS